MSWLLEHVWVGAAVYVRICACVFLCLWLSNWRLHVCCTLGPISHCWSKCWSTCTDGCAFKVILNLSVLRCEDLFCNYIWEMVAEHPFRCSSIHLLPYSVFISKQRFLRIMYKSTGQKLQVYIQYSYRPYCPPIKPLVWLHQMFYILAVV